MLVTGRCQGIQECYIMGAMGADNADRYWDYYHDPIMADLTEYGDRYIDIEWKHYDGKLAPPS